MAEYEVTGSIVVTYNVSVVVQAATEDGAEVLGRDLFNTWSPTVIAPTDSNVEVQDEDRRVEVDGVEEV